MPFNVFSLERSQKRRFLMACDGVIIALSLWLSLALRLGELWPEPWLRSSIWLFILLPTVGVPIFHVLGVYRSLLRSIGRHGYSRIACGVIVLVLILAIVDNVGEGKALPTSVPMILAFVLFISVCLLRFVGQSFYHWRSSRLIHKEPVIIFGAGDTGTRLAAALDRGTVYNPVAFVDDDRHLHKSIIHGCNVLPTSDLGQLISRYEVSKVFLAIPSATARRRHEILKSLTDYGVEIQSVPSMAELVGGFARVDQLREVDSHDILHRETVSPIPHLIAESIEGKSVAVTGGGGSIGLELCRQIVAAGPKCLVFYELSELALYKAMRELQGITSSSGRKVPIHAVLGSVCEKRRLADTLRKHRVQTLYHAAAYKHVPIVENNVIVGVENNALGTKVVADTCGELGVERAILVSSDKAVRPTNIMGATKRLAELTFQSAQLTYPETIFSMVRFGNVINSSGSVIPLFQSQIKNYGPVTVTHPDVTRYFMTISEASQLVIQAGSLAKGGDVFLLDMGPPLRIADLARRMIELSGFSVKDERNPDGDIEVVYTGLRPGEKLYEELLIHPNALKSEHPKIMRAVEEMLSVSELNEITDGLVVAVDEHDTSAAVRLLKQAVPEYQPAPLGSDRGVRRPASEDRQRFPHTIPSLAEGSPLSNPGVSARSNETVSTDKVETKATLPKSVFRLTRSDEDLNDVKAANE